MYYEIVQMDAVISWIAFTIIYLGIGLVLYPLFLIMDPDLGEDLPIKDRLTLIFFWWFVYILSVVLYAVVTAKPKEKGKTKCLSY